MADGVLSVGNLVVDLLVRPVEAIRWGATIHVESIEQHIGGNGANTCYTLATLGTRVRLLGSLGRDEFGDFVEQRLRDAGCETSGLERSPEGTATTIGLVNAAGERGFLHRLGATAATFIAPEDFERELRAGGFALYHLASPYSLIAMRGIHAELLRRARSAGAATSLDAQWDTRGRWMLDLAPCLPHVDYLFANEDEARHLCGTTDPAIAGRTLREAGARVVVLKLGARGCAVVTDQGVDQIPGFAVNAIDTTGAGDCFVGGFLDARLRGASLTESAGFANAVAAMSVERLGGTAGVVSRAATEAWMRAR
jgi:sugar/nucleoside kinase (ribokinase family)